MSCKFRCGIQCGRHKVAMYICHIDRRYLPPVALICPLCVLYLKVCKFAFIPRCAQLLKPKWLAVLGSSTLIGAAQRVFGRKESEPAWNLERPGKFNKITSSQVTKAPKRTVQSKSSFREAFNFGALKCAMHSWLRTDWISICTLQPCAVSGWIEWNCSQKKCSG